MCLVGVGHSPLWKIRAYVGFLLPGCTGSTSHTLISSLQSPRSSVCSPPPDFLLFVPINLFLRHKATVFRWMSFMSMTTSLPDSDSDAGVDDGFSWFSTLRIHGTAFQGSFHLHSQ